MIDHHVARQAAQRLINGAFNNGGEKPRFHIPSRPDDDDLLVMAYIDQQSDKEMK